MLVVIPLAAAGIIRVVGNNTNISLGGAESVIAWGDYVLIVELDDNVAAAKSSNAGVGECVLLLD